MNPNSIWYKLGAFVWCYLHYLVTCPVFVDLSGVVPSPEVKYFFDMSEGYIYYFQLVDGGLPSTVGTCIFDPQESEGNVVSPYKRSCTCVRMWHPTGPSLLQSALSLSFYLSLFPLYLFLDLSLTNVFCCFNFHFSKAGQSDGASSCYPLGLQSQQAWSYDDSNIKYPQLQITFYGGDSGRFWRKKIYPAVLNAALLNHTSSILDNR